MPRKENPKAAFHTLRIEHEVFERMKFRSQELRMSSAKYVSKLIIADTLDRATQPLIVYPKGYSGPKMKLTPLDK